MPAKWGRLHVYRDRTKQWRWTLIAKNGRKVACSGEGYTHRVHAYLMGMKVCGVGVYVTKGDPR